jgi:cytoskeletal protein CcmA (bactofilin family)
MKQHADFQVREKGSAFFVITIFAITSTLLVGAFLSTSLAKVRHVELRVAETSAFNAAESGLNAAIARIWTIYKSSSDHERVAAVDKLDGKHDEDDKLVIEDRQVGRSRFTVEVRRVVAAGLTHADVELVSTGTNGSATSTVVAAVRFGRKPSEVFNHAYFINNFGWLWGSTITVNGSVRSNGNFSVRNATVNGDIHASENEDIGAAGTVTGDSSNKTIDEYNGLYGNQARPTNPAAPPEDANGNGILDPGEDTNGNGELDDFEYEGGYDGESERFEAQQPVDMPYLGDLAVYRDLATHQGGKLSQGETVLIDAVLGDDDAESDDIILVGTEEDPLIIDGPVVVEGDVVIRGVIKGRGTIYAGRNVHVVGNLSYETPPQWPKPATDLEAMKAANANSDLVGLAAKGSVIIGDYTQSWWKSATNYYQRPPFTQSYQVDPSDAANGYVTGTDGDGNPTFHGNYTAYDGGEKLSNGGSGTEPRRYYESSFSDELVRASASDGYVTQIDAILYTNHLLSGRIGACTFNGTIVSRDEALIYSGWVDMNYDPRVRDDGYEYIDIYLPREPTYRILYWSQSQ